MFGPAPRVRRFARNHAFRPIDSISATAFDWLPIELRDQMRQVKKWFGMPDTNISCAFEGPWRGNDVELYVIHVPGATDDHSDEDYLCANTRLGAVLGPTAIGARWLVQRKGLRGVEPTDIGIDPLPYPKRMKDHAAYHGQLMLRTLDKPREATLARSSLVRWFTETPRGALIFETYSSSDRLGAVAAPHGWEKDLEGFLNSLIEFRDLLAQVLEGASG